MLPGVALDGALADPIPDRTLSSLVVERIDVHVGTAGWTYDDWQGEFYPPQVTGTERLAFYATRFDAVEVNASFYRVPTDAMVAAWRRRLPLSFHLVLKGPRRITHRKELGDATEFLDFFARHAAAFVAVSHPRLPAGSIPTTDLLYVRFHGLGKSPYDQRLLRRRAPRVDAPARAPARGAHALRLLQQRPARPCPAERGEIPRAAPGVAPRPGKAQRAARGAVTKGRRGWSGPARSGILFRPPKVIARAPARPRARLPRFSMT